MVTHPVHLLRSKSSNPRVSLTTLTTAQPYGGTPACNCAGTPHRGNIGLIRSFHRPSDDACTYQYLIPSNMMFSAALNASASLIMSRMPPSATSGAANLT